LDAVRCPIGRAVAVVVATARVNREVLMGIVSCAHFPQQTLLHAGTARVNRGAMWSPQLL